MFFSLKTLGLYFFHLPRPLTCPLCPQVSLVLSALQAGNKGTQACITAATAVSGIIADLDTTIMFATAGTLNAENNETFADHRYGSDSHPGGSWTGRSSVWPDGLWRCCPTSRNTVMHFYFGRVFKMDMGEMDHVIQISAFSQLQTELCSSFAFHRLHPVCSNFFIFFFLISKLKSYALDFFTNPSGTGSGPARCLAPT